MYAKPACPAAVAAMASGASMCWMQRPKEAAPAPYTPLARRSLPPALLAAMWPAVKKAAGLMTSANTASTCTQRHIAPALRRPALFLDWLASAMLLGAHCPAGEPLPLHSNVPASTCDYASMLGQSCWFVQCCHGLIGRCTKAVCCQGSNGCEGAKTVGRTSRAFSRV